MEWEDSDFTFIEEHVYYEFYGGSDELTIW